MAVDVACCGDSGSASKLSSRPTAGTCSRIAIWSPQRLSSESACGGLPTLSEQDSLPSRAMPIPVRVQHPEQVRQLLYCEPALQACVLCCSSSLLTASLHVIGCAVQAQSSSLPMAVTPRMPKAVSELSEQQASTEMAFRLNHARQTVEFVQRQVRLCKLLNACCQTM